MIYMLILRLGHMCQIKQGLHLGHKIDSQSPADVRKPTNTGPYDHIVFIEHFYVLQL